MLIHTRTGGTGIHYFFMTAHEARAFEGGEGEIEREHREMKLEKKDMGWAGKKGGRKREVRQKERGRGK